MNQFWFDSLAFFVFNNNICKHNAYKMRIYKVLEPTFNHSHSIMPQEMRRSFYISNANIWVA